MCQIDGTGVPRSPSSRVATSRVNGRKPAGLASRLCWYAGSSRLPRLQSAGSWLHYLLVRPGASSSGCSSASLLTQQIVRIVLSGALGVRDSVRLLGSNVAQFVSQQMWLLGDRGWPQRDLYCISGSLFLEWRFLRAWASSVLWVATSRATSAS